MSWDDPHAWRASYDAWKTDMLDSYSYGDGPSMDLRMPAKVAPLTEKHEAEARTAYRAKVDAGWSEET